MATLPESRGTESRTAYRDHAIPDDPSIGHALERIFDAGQTLIVRRMDLLVMEMSALSAQTIRMVAISVVGGVTTLVGWLILLAGVTDWLDDYFARQAVEIAIGLVHLAVGVALLLWRRRVARAAT
jgi:uncharacterized membrane protein YqjE